MKVVVRSSSLLFFFTNVLLGLPIRRRALGNPGVGMEENPLPGGGSERFGWSVLPPQQENSAAERVAE
ncbi:MAG TPA: hypothetical protein VLM42_01745 [Bryobacteraceae bacterium]|nr:hypothetical protein [Bryobacteraceae bacterium]